MIEQRPFEVIVFDLGGVLVELTGVSRMLDLLDNRMGVEELWTLWLASESVRGFESGRVATGDFAAALVAEFGLPIAADQFIAEFTDWPRGTYPGTLELLRALRQEYTLACLTNTNALHWPRVCDEMGLRACFDLNFASHEIGMLKPDAAVFAHVVERLGVAPERILFLDDNQINIDAAVAAGMTARRAIGLDGAIDCLEALGVLPARVR